MKPEYLINPSFRLTTRYLSVAWHTTDAVTLSVEGAIEQQGRYTVRNSGGNVELIVQHFDATVDVISHPDTDFDSGTTQRRLRDIFCEIITRRACEILPARVHYWEERTGLKARCVSVEKTRKNILGSCTADNEIILPPYLVIFKEEWMDGVILHEMAHLRHKHHRKPFWDLLSQLLGTDSRKAKVKDDIALSPYYDYYCYLTGS